MSFDLIYGKDEYLLPWAADKIGLLGQFDIDARTIGLGKNGELKAVFVFENFSDCGCYLHVASTGESYWPRGFLRAACAYPFIQLGLNRMTGMVFAKNTPAVNACKKFGFKQEGVMRQALKDDDMIIFGMLRQECRWI